VADFDEVLEELQKHMDCAVQNWLLGAGVSLKSNIPLMFGLTERIETLIESECEAEEKDNYKAIKADLADGSHIEHILSHIGDLIALAERSKSKRCWLDGDERPLDELNKLYEIIIKFIGDTVRYGYRAADAASGITEIIGTLKDPIVDIEQHRLFIGALFGVRANLENRSKISFFTTNYDTLLEDALTLEKKLVVDGFSGGAMGFWSPQSEFSKDGRLIQPSEVYKLHGSIDWNNDPRYGLLRCRYGVRYLSEPGQVLIYPQATKYVETQKDPFAFLFSQFRNHLGSGEDNTFILCGYSFGDDHINSEIQESMRRPSSRTTLIAFSREGAAGLPGLLKVLLEDPLTASRIFVATEKGLYNGNTDLISSTLPGDLSWWSFEGLTNFLVNGIPA
jgi:SIR2-like protein